MSLPGKHMEQLRLAPSQMMPRAQLKKPLKDILRDISRRSKATVDMRGGPGGSIIFEGKGSVESVRQALKEVAQQVGSKVCYDIFLIDVPCTSLTHENVAIGPHSHPNIRSRPHHWPSRCNCARHSTTDGCTRPSAPRR